MPFCNADIIIKYIYYYDDHERHKSRESFLHMNFKKSFCFAVAVFSGIIPVLYISFLALPSFVDENAILKLVNDFSAGNGFETTVKSPKFNTNKDLTVDLSVEELKFGLKGENPAFALKNAETKIFLPAFVFSRFEISNFSAREITVDSRETAKFPKQNSKIKPDLTKAQIDIDDYSVFLGNNAVLKGDLKFAFKKGSETVNLLNGKVLSGSSKTDVKLKITMSPSGLGKEIYENLFVTGYIKRLDLKEFEPILKTYAGVSDAKGIVSAEVATFGEKNAKSRIFVTITGENILINSEVASQKIKAPGAVLISADVVVDGKSFDIKKAYLSAPGVDAGVAGKIKLYDNDKVPKFDLRVKVKNTYAEKLLDLLPGVIRQIKLTKVHGVSGFANGEATVRGKFPDMHLFGSVDVENAHALRGYENTHVGRINLKFDDTNIFTNIDLTTSTGGMFKLRGRSDVNPAKGSHFEVQTAGKLMLPLVSKILVPIGEIFDLQLGPVPQLKVTDGWGDTVLIINGTKKSAMIDGYVNIYHTFGEYVGIGAKLSDISGRVDFKHDKVYFKTTAGKAENSPAFLSGVSSLTEKTLDMKIEAKNAYSKDIKKIVFDSPLLIDIKNGLNELVSMDGRADLSVRMSGVVDDTVPPGSLDSIKNLKIDGFLKMFDNGCRVKSYAGLIDKINGVVNFTEENITFDDVKLKIFNSPIRTSGRLKTDKNKKRTDGTVYVSGNGTKVADTLKAAALLTAKEAQMLAKSATSLKNVDGLYNFKSTIKVKDSVPDFPTAKVTATSIPSTAPKNVLVLKNGNFYLNNGTLKLDKLRFCAENSEIKADGTVKNVFGTPRYNIFASTKNFAAKYVHAMFLSGMAGEEAALAANEITSVKGNVNGFVSISGNSDKGKFVVNNFEFTDKFTKIPFKFNNSVVEIRKNSLYLNNLHGIAGDISKVTGNFEIGNYRSENPSLTGNLSIKITPELAEKYINPKMTHPVRITDEIGLTADFSGLLSDLNTRIIAFLDKGSDVSLFSTNLGDSDVIRRIVVRMKSNADTLNILNFEYLRNEINSFGKEVSVPCIRGGAVLKKRGAQFVPVSANIATRRPMSAKLLNIIFKKSLIKSGTFECNLAATITGQIAQVTGSGALNDVSVPLYETFIKSAKMNAQRKSMNLKLEAQIFKTHIDGFMNSANTTRLPFVVNKLEVTTKGTQNLEKTAQSIYKTSMESYTNKILKQKPAFDISDIIVREGHLKSDSAIFKTAEINDLNIDFSLDARSVLRIIIREFTMAGGKVKGRARYDFSNGSLGAKIAAYGVDSDKTAEAFFDSKGQIEGFLNGSAYFSTKGFEQAERLRNLNGKFRFVINEGKMTKLGSLEYLLRATNIVSSGLTALSVHNAIALIHPVNKGAFSKVSGDFNIKNGVIEDIKIFSRGEHLSTYISGKYDYSEDNGDIVVFGKFGRKTSGVFGPVGDLSLNAFFNMLPFSKDPGIYASDILLIPDVTYKGDDYRVFRASVKGELNGSDNVSDFKWVK